MSQANQVNQMRSESAVPIFGTRTSGTTPEVTDPEDA